MGSSDSKLSQPWRVIDWGAKKQLLTYVRNYKPVGASHLRILVCGPVGVGKSSFINTVGSVIVGDSVNVAATNARYTYTKSFTLQYKTHKFKTRNQRKTVPIVFNDIMGLEPLNSRGVLAEDIILAMKGHVKDGYTFNQEYRISPQHEKYNHKPSIDDRVHVLVCMLDANATDIHPSVIQKIKEIRKAARDLGIPQVAVVTHIDEICVKVEQDVKKVFKSSILKKKVDQFSSSVGIPVNHIFPVRNNYEGVQKDAVDTLMLTALKHMLNYGDDYLDAC